jgi:hypothetical protein
MRWEGVHEAGDDTSLAAVLLAGGVFERVEQWTPVDEVIEGEACLLERCDVASVLIPVDDYEELIAAYGKRALGLDRTLHREVAAGACVVLPREIEQQMMRAKLNTLSAFGRYVWFDADNLWDAMRNLLAITLRHTPQFLKGMSGAQVGKMLGVGRAAFNRHKLKLVEEFLERWGVSPVHGSGGKGEEHRRKKSEQMKGRRHRAEDYEAAPPETEERLTQRQLDAMHDEHERLRIAKLSGVDPDAIDLKKTWPARAGKSEATPQRKTA